MFLLCIWVVVKIMAPFLGTYYNTAPRFRVPQKGTLVLTTTHMAGNLKEHCYDGSLKAIKPPEQSEPKETDSTLAMAFYVWVVVKILVPFWGALNIRCRII